MLWLVSYFQPLVVSSPVGPNDIRFIHVSHGTVTFARLWASVPPPESGITIDVTSLGERHLTYSHGSGSSGAPVGRPVWFYARGSSRGRTQIDTYVITEGSYYWSVSLGFLTLVLVTPTIVVLVRSARRKRRLKIGCCTVCGYDLRATPDRCPECGTEPPAAQRKAQGLNPGL
jgi:hypothetical protein